MATAPGLMVPLAMRALRNAVRKGFTIVRERLPKAGQELRNLEPALARNVNRIETTGRVGQKQARHYFQNLSNSNHVRYYSTAGRHSTSGGAQAGSRIKGAVGRVTATSPFASTLRPKLNCGAFPRSSGGFSMGGSARYFSHTPVAPADVITQVSQAMRAFMLSGKDMAYNRRRGGHRSYVKGQIRAQLAAASTDSLAPGAYVDFRLAPTLSCLSPYDPVGSSSLDDTRGGFLDELNADFTSMVSDISAIFQDLRRLASLGDLPITLVDANTLRVHFRGCDAELVNRLCDEVGVCRGVVHEDERFAFDQITPSMASEVDWKDMMSNSSSSGDSLYYDENMDFADELMSAPSWTESGEEFYDEIDPGGLSSSSDSSSHVLLRRPIDGITDVLDPEEYRNPWAIQSTATISSCA